MFERWLREISGKLYFYADSHGITLVRKYGYRHARRVYSDGHGRETTKQTPRFSDQTHSFFFWLFLPIPNANVMITSNIITCSSDNRISEHLALPTVPYPWSEAIAWYPYKAVRPESRTQYASGRSHDAPLEKAHPVRMFNPCPYRVHHDRHDPCPDHEGRRDQWPAPPPCAPCSLASVRHRLGAYREGGNRAF